MSEAGPSEDHRPEYGIFPEGSARPGICIPPYGRERGSLSGVGNDFTFIGLISMMDPPRPESKAAVANAIRAGIKPIMITGDHKVTASAIAQKIGILQEGDTAVTGMELDAMDEKELDEKLDKISVYARVSPEHKIRIVDAWQRKGNIVAMTGDGVNDAPALKKADIGVAMVLPEPRFPKTRLP